MSIGFAIYKNTNKKLNKSFLKVTPPPFWYGVFRRVSERRQYAKTKYAVRKNVISYADHKFYIKLL